ncbi:hypothetical protein ABER99_01920 [Paenibacillus glucanolyticus]|nr:hypothetical protein [Paenibacillus glucanolyticus]
MDRTPGLIYVAFNILQHKGKGKNSYLLSLQLKCVPTPFLLQ